tara:strand:+ start:107 stop:325 length:219 start_codon:yes stop_codon:yes gene_type:complete
MGEVIYGVFDNSMWELHVHVRINGEEGYYRHVRCRDEHFPQLISRKVNDFDKQQKNYRVYLDGELVHQTDYR